MDYLTKKEYLWIDKSSNPREYKEEHSKVEEIVHNL